MRANSKQGLWALAALLLVAGFDAAWREWGEWAAIGAAAVVVALIVQLRRSGITGPRPRRRVAGAQPVRRPERAPTVAPRQDAEEAFGSLRGGLLQRSRRRPRL